MAERKKLQSKGKYKGGESKADWNVPDPCICSSFLLHVTALDMLDIQDQRFAPVCSENPPANGALQDLWQLSLSTNIVFQLKTCIKQLLSTSFLKFRQYPG